MTTTKNQPEWMTLHEEFFGISESHSIQYDFNINSHGDCLVWLTKINNETKAMYKTKPKYFRNTDDACEHMKEQAQKYCKFMQEKLCEQSKELTS